MTPGTVPTPAYSISIIYQKPNGGLLHTLDIIESSSENQAFKDARELHKPQTENYTILSEVILNHPLKMNLRVTPKKVRALAATLTMIADGLNVIADVMAHIETKKGSK